MEHLSRRTTRDVQTLLVVTDPTQRGIVAAERSRQFSPRADIQIESSYLILNSLRTGTVPSPLQTQIDALDIPLLGVVPYDDQIMEFEFNGRPLVEMGERNRHLPGGGNHAAQNTPD